MRSIYCCKVVLAIVFLQLVLSQPTVRLPARANERAPPFSPPLTNVDPRPPRVIPPQTNPIAMPTPVARRPVDSFPPASPTPTQPIVPPTSTTPTTPTRQPIVPPTSQLPTPITPAKQPIVPPPTSRFPPTPFTPRLIPRFARPIRAPAFLQHQFLPQNQLIPGRRYRFIRGRGFIPILTGVPLFQAQWPTCASLCCDENSMETCPEQCYEVCENCLATESGCEEAKFCQCINPLPQAVLVQSLPGAEVSVVNPEQQQQQQ